MRSIENILGITLLAIFFIYSSSVEFMPNFKERSDMWHLFYQIHIIYFVLFLLLLVSLIIIIIKREKVKRKYIVLEIILSILFFTLLNSFDGASTAYVFFVGLFIFYILNYFDIKIIEKEKD